ncbi:MAG: hypothetical protein ACOX69_07220 [Coriobacteriales bacterium]|jgi:hypothetical protein
MPKGKHSSKKMGFKVPKGPAAPTGDAEDEVEVPEEIAKTARGQMQTQESAAAAAAADEAAASEAAAADDAAAAASSGDEAGLLDEWIERQDGEQSEEARKDVEKKKQARSDPFYKKGRAAIIAVVIFAALVVAGIFYFSFRPSASPSETVDTALTAVQRQDMTTFQSSCSSDVSDVENELSSALSATIGVNDLESAADSLNDQQKQTLEELTDKLVDFDYEIGGERIDGDTATVEVKLKTYDFSSFFQKVVGEYVLQAADTTFDGSSISMRDAATLFADLVSDNLSQLGDKSVETQTTFSLKKENGAWKISAVSSDNIDALTGGLYSFLIGESTTTDSDDSSADSEDVSEDTTTYSDASSLASSAKSSSSSSK